MQIREMSCAERPREKLVNLGKENLTDSELLAILLRSGTREYNVVDLARKILVRYSLKTLCNMSIRQLSKINGIGPAKASCIAAISELAKRLELAGIEKPSAITRACDLAPKYISKLRNEKKEHLYVVLLDCHCGIIAEHLVGIGVLDEALARPREIFEYAIKESAAFIIVIHNHPSGNPVPSDSDERVTRQLLDASHIIQIPLLDHIIVGYNGFVSMRQQEKGGF